MKLLRSCHCQTAFEDDLIESQSNPDRPIRPSGLNIISHLASCLQAIGFTVPEPDQHSDYGWAIFPSTEKERYWVMVSRLTNDVVIATEDTSFLSWLSHRRKKYAEFLGHLQHLLQNDPNFSNIAWFKTGQSDHKNPSFQSPVIH